MRMSKVILLAASFFTSVAHTGTLEFTQSGFSIDSLNSSPTQGMIQPIQMFLPAKNGFAPNVNVQIQAYNGTITEYKELSIGQFKQFGLTLISTIEDGNSITFEYKGYMQGLNLHWYAKAFKKRNHIYLVTATGTENEWATEKDILIKNVNSFELK